MVCSLVLLQVLYYKFCPLITAKISLCDDEHASYHINQVPLHSPRLNWFHALTVLTSFLNFCNDYDACEICHQLQEGGLSYLGHDELGSIVQSIHKIARMNFSLFIANWEFDISSNSFDHFSILGDYHLTYHFLMISTSNDSFFVLSNIHCLTYLYSYFHEEGEALQPSLMVMAGPHYLGITVEDDQIYFSLQYSHHDPSFPIENSSFYKITRLSR